MFDGEMTQEEFGRALTRALQMLAASGDQEAFDAIKKAKENGGRLEMTQAEAQKFIDRANQGGGGGGGAAKDEPAKEEPAKEEPPKKPDLEKVKEAVKRLAKKGDKDAQVVIDHALRNRGELKVTDEEGWDFIVRAFPEEEVNAPVAKAKDEDKDQDPAKPDMAKAEEAVTVLAKKGDKEARAVVDRARRNHGEMDLSTEEAKTFLDRAIEKELIDPEKANPGGEAERMPPQQVQQLIKILAERGDRDAKSIMRKSKKNDGEIKYTKEEEEEIIKNAKQAGLIN
ncbi:MAG: hypothetical protein K9N23_04025 [Akkermansiaceae bacterium]|nr:hypothetical protein [Akkermansiaceae bacterium]